MCTRTHHVRIPLFDLFPDFSVLRTAPGPQGLRFRRLSHHLVLTLYHQVYRQDAL